MAQDQRLWDAARERFRNLIESEDSSEDDWQNSSLTVRIFSRKVSHCGYMKMICIL
jgi:hypothetical protein